MVSPAMGAAMMGTMYFLRANCAQHGGGACGGGLICASLLCYRALVLARFWLFKEWVRNVSEKRPSGEVRVVQDDCAPELRFGAEAAGQAGVQADVPRRRPQGLPGEDGHGPPLGASPQPEGQVHAVRQGELAMRSQAFSRNDTCLQCSR